MRYLHQRPNGPAPKRRIEFLRLPSGERKLTRVLALNPEPTATKRLPESPSPYLARQGVDLSETL
jgi:hypothetical protein